MPDPELIQFLNEQLNKAAADLGEHFEAVQILAVYNDEQTTMLMSGGVGNVFTRHGMLSEYSAQLQAQRTLGVMAALQPPQVDF